MTVDNGLERQSALDTLTAFFRSIGMQTSPPTSQTEKVIKQHAVTKDKRQKLLDTFFSAVFAQVITAHAQNR